MLFIVQFAIDSVLDTNKVCDNTWHKIFNGKINSDIVILGNSKAEAHYNPKIFEDLTGYSTYNLGVSGTPINILNIRWQSYINRNKLPKLVIIDVDYNILGTSNELFEKFQYLPYINNKEYKAVVKNIDNDYFYEKTIPMYKYRGYEMQVFNKIKLVGDTIECHNFYKGFKPHDKPWDEENWAIFSKRIRNEKYKKKDFKEIYNKGFEELNKIALFCKENKIEVCFVWSPQYAEIYDYKRELRVFVDSVLSGIARKNNINYIDFFEDSIVYDKSNFYDKSHLNLTGANMFSEKIGNYLNANIFKN